MYKNQAVGICSSLQVTSSPSETTDYNTLRFDFTGTVQQFIVPPGVEEITVQAYGASGGQGYNSGRSGQGGLGGYISGKLSVEPNQVLYILVGGKGADRTGDYAISSTSGGYNGGGMICGPNTGEGRQ